MASLFNKNLPPSCAYCLHGRESLVDGEILCKKHGVTESHDACRHYCYDPLKRVPKKTKISDQYDPEDFSIS